MCWCSQVVVDAGVADPARLAVGGHSYGAFMAANLLAHAGHLFAAGIARSGAYNRCIRRNKVIWMAADSQDVFLVLRFIQQHLAQNGGQCVDICALQRGCKIVVKLFWCCCGIFVMSQHAASVLPRTLTPFGFQAEERTLWQASDTYAMMSPFQNADKIKKPLLLIHGADDNNTGQTLQSPCASSAFAAIHHVVIAHRGGDALVDLPRPAGAVVRCSLCTCGNWRGVLRRRHLPAAVGALLRRPEGQRRALQTGHPAPRVARLQV